MFDRFRGGYSVSKATFASHVNTGVTPPTFSRIDTSVYPTYSSMPTAQGESVRADERQTEYVSM